MNNLNIYIGYDSKEDIAYRVCKYSILKRCFYLMNKGADAIYCPQSSRFIKAIADEGIPVIGHSGFIPYKSTHYGGFKAVGKTNIEAKKILSEIIKIKEAGAFAVELEIVPSKIATEISKVVDIFLIGMGSGLGCDAQYLFSEDVLGYNTGHIPRHAKVYSDLHKDFDALQKQHGDTPLPSFSSQKDFKESINLNISCIAEAVAYPLNLSFTTPSLSKI